MKRKMNDMLAIGLTGTIIFGFIFASNFMEAHWGNKDIWWTPMAKAVPLDQAKEHFELYIGGRLLQRHLEQETLSAVDQTGKPYKVVSNDVRVRLNNWDEVKTLKLNNAVITAFFLGISFALLVMGLIRFFAGKEDGR
ncbi:MAG TPA: hypothetical protein PLT45_01970 [Smithella sp.]|nr:hypothetical protein [Smithella sp.]